MKYYSRDIEAVLLKAVKQFRVVSLSGARQTGKSTLLRHCLSDTHQFVSLDDPRILKLAQNDPEFFFEEYSAPLIIDEIQYAPELLKYIKLRVDKNSERGQYVLTGSQQFTLMKGLQETLAGRVALLTLTPMSINEGPQKTRKYEYRALRGSYPEIVTVEIDDFQRWFMSYLATYIGKDVQVHYKLEKTALFRDMLFLLAARVGQILNYHALATDLGVSVVAIKSWIKILEAAGIIYVLRPYHTNLGSRITKSPKIYFMDTGFAAVLTGIKTKDALFHGALSGNLFENFVLQEIIKVYENRGMVPPLYYYRTNNGIEVDILIEEKFGEILPCEVKLTKTPKSSMIHNIERLYRLNKKKNLKILKGALITNQNGQSAMSREVKSYSLNGFLDTI